MNNFNYWFVVAPLMLFIIWIVAFLSVRVSDSGKLEEHLGDGLLNIMCSIASLVFFFMLTSESGRGIIQLTANQEDGRGPSVLAASFIAVGAALTYFVISWISAGFINMCRFEYLNGVCDKVKKGVHDDLMKKLDAEYGDYIEALHEELGYQPGFSNEFGRVDDIEEGRSSSEISRSLDVQIFQAYENLEKARDKALAEIQASCEAYL